MKQIVLASSFMVLFVACSREEPTSYQVPKEEPAPAPQQTVQSMPMGSDADMQMVQAAHASMMANASEPVFTAELPEGWSEKTASGMRLADYAIGDTSIDFYMIPLSVGDVSSNVNRWRGQVGLADASPEEIARDVESFQIDGHNVNYVEIYNTDGGKGIIAAIVDMAPMYWYFTAKGAVDELKANAADIRKFVESIKIKN